MLEPSSAENDRKISGINAGTKPQLLLGRQRQILDRLRAHYEIYGETSNISKCFYPLFEVAK